MAAGRHRRQGRNLLLNVGPRGVDGAVPDEQLLRLDWLGEWTRTHHRALFDTRPWVHPGSATADGRPLRYTARGGTVFALVGGGAGDAVLGEVRTTPTTAVTAVDGRPVAWSEGPGGLTVEVAPRAVDAGPAVVVLEHVEARAGPSDALS